MADDHDHGREGHNHGGHGHGRAHPGASATGRAFAIGVGLNSAFIVIEVIYGLAAHSMALVADAAHNLSDVLGLVLAWGAMVLARRKPSRRFTYGLRRTTVLSALANAVLLLVVLGGVAWEAIQRLRHPAEVGGKTVMIVAAIGVLVNGGSALLFLAGSKKDVNVRAAFLHLASDAVAALGVVIAGAVMLFTRWMWLDPVVSLIVAIATLVGTWSLLRKSITLSLDAVPEHIEPDDVQAHLEALPGVKGVHDLHIWSMSTTECALTAHLEMEESDPAFLKRTCDGLKARFEIKHSTLQVETPEMCADPCALGDRHHSEHPLPAGRAHLSDGRPRSKDEVDDEWD